MASSQQSRSEWFANLDTSHWTAEDWEAARCLAEQLRLQNVAGAGRAAERLRNQGSVQGM
jgi:hypothetical protein